MSLNYRCIIFDLDNTLYDETEYFIAVFKEISKIISNIIRSKNEKQIYYEILNEFSVKGSQYPNFFLYITKKYNLNEKFHNVFYNIYKNINANMSLYSDAKYILKWLKSEGYLLGLITNGTVESQWNKIRLLNLEKIMDCMCVAREFGIEFEKPNTFPYKYIVKKLKVSPSETIYVGDNPINDFQGAKKIGMTTVRIKRGEFKNLRINVKYIDFEINSFYELRNIIRGEV